MVWLRVLSAKYRPDVSSLGQYIYAQSEDSLYVNQFISSSSTVEIGGQEIEFSMDSTYMKDGAVRITAKCGKREEALYPPRAYPGVPSRNPLLK